MFLFGTLKLCVCLVMILLGRPLLSCPKIYLRPWGLSGGNRTRSQEKEIPARDHLATEICFGRNLSFPSIG